LLLLLIASVYRPATGSTELYPYIIKTCIRYVGIHIGEVFLPGLVRYWSSWDDEDGKVEVAALIFCSPW
jgi:cyanate permease